MNTELTITKGQALVFVGPQGGGKTTLATQLAQKHGAFVEIDAHQLDNDSMLSSILDGEPDTVIVEGLPRRQKTLHSLKAMLTCDTVAIRPPYKNPRQVKAPNFIFCSSDMDALKGIDGNRRFRVVPVGI